MASVLFRPSLVEASEFESCKAHLPTYTSRMDLPHDDVIVGRYSVLPYYEELEADLARIGSRLINTVDHHRWIADVMRWAPTVLEGMTPRSWESWGALPEGQYVVKGRTNSRKHQWRTHMFAPTRADVPVIGARLLDDPLIRDQGIIVREYIPLKQIGEGLNGLPVTNEWRTFWLADENGVHKLAAGFYWQGSHPEARQFARFSREADILAQKAADAVASAGPRFFVLDLAETASGDWTVIEVNDGQMSGLCGVEADTLYAQLRRRTVQT